MVCSRTFRKYDSCPVYTVSPNHIFLLMEIVLKEKHGIRKSDINLENKMNYDAVVRLRSPTVQKLIKENLKIINLILSSYTEKNLSPRERIYRIWMACGTSLSILAFLAQV
uniref:Uncharacterized protein n=1 Tax=Daphnia galeata TaxID=27404 RepID=A0A8J2WEI8_9CRUS|nr:unnamed protein product [Daphnia galeata]